MLYLTDVTARRQAEQEVREQRTFYEAMLAHLPAVVTVLDPDQRYLYINPYAADTPEERTARLGTTFTERCASKDLPPELANAPVLVKPIADADLLAGLKQLLSTS